MTWNPNLMSENPLQLRLKTVLKPHTGCTVNGWTVPLTLAHLPGAFTFGTLCAPDNSSSRVKLPGFVFSLQDRDHAARYRLWNHKIMFTVLFTEHKVLYYNTSSTSTSITLLEGQMWRATGINTGATFVLHLHAATWSQLQTETCSSKVHFESIKTPTF